jgi:predicted dehydrogenase
MVARIAIIGFGKIARDQHVPAIATNPGFELIAISTRSGDPGIGVPCHAEPASLFAALKGRLNAVAICTPPCARHSIAIAAMEAGLDVLLEKPPAATLGEVDHLADEARRRGRVLYAGWHSQHAAGVETARAALLGKRIQSLDIQWLEDVRKWHPGQDWIWEPDGFGVFDPGINALSIATRILPEPLFVRGAHLAIPDRRQAPIAADIDFGPGKRAVFDWRSAEGEQWTILITTGDGRRIELRDGGDRLFVDGVEQKVERSGEYPSLYRRFAQLVAARQTEVDREPLRLVADACLIGRRETTMSFIA